MNVFWVLFLVLFNTIGNQGDPNHGLKNFKNGSGDIPLYIVSLRNRFNDHICTGSIISTTWILTTHGWCSNTKYILHGLREYYGRETMQGIPVKNMEWINTAIIIELCAWLPLPKEEGWKTRPKCKHELAKQELNTVAILSIPPHSNSILPQTGEVIGWSYDGSKGKYVMKRIADVNTTEAFSKPDEEFFKPFFWMRGSPLIDGDVIYVLVSYDPDHLYSILPYVDEIRRITNITS